MPELSEQDDREALARIIYSTIYKKPNNLNRATEAADAILAAGFRRSPEPQQVGTVAELDALPVGAVFRDRNGETWVIQDDDTQGYAAYSSAWGNEVLQTVTFERRGLFPLLVLWVPDTEGGESRG